MPETDQYRNSAPQAQYHSSAVAASSASMTAMVSHFVFPTEPDRLPIQAEPPKYGHQMIDMATGNLR